MSRILQFVKTAYPEVYEELLGLLPKELRDLNFSSIAQVHNINKRIKNVLEPLVSNYCEDFDRQIELLGPDKSLYELTVSDLLSCQRLLWLVLFKYSEHFNCSVSPLKMVYGSVSFDFNHNSTFEEVSSAALENYELLSTLLSVRVTSVTCRQIDSFNFRLAFIHKQYTELMEAFKEDIVKYGRRFANMNLTQCSGMVLRLFSLAVHKMYLGHDDY